MRARRVESTRVVCRTPKILYGVFPYLLMIHSFSTLLLQFLLLSSLKYCLSVYIQHKICFSFLQFISVTSLY